MRVPGTARRLVLALALVGAFVAGFLLRGPAEQPAPAASPESHSARHGERWTCSMHPQIQLPEAGACPICGMDLIPVRVSGGEDRGSRAMVFSESARRLAQIRTVPVERRLATVAVRMVGKVDYDETRTGYITSYVPGRLERLFVDYTGVRVGRGDHMVTIYSPELIAAQEELLQAIDARRRLEKSELEIMRRTAADTVDASRERLRLWGLLPEQIAEIEEGDGVQEVVTLYSPMSGVVIDKNARQGMYVETGTRIYTIADLEHLWVRLEAYESDIEWVHLGQPVEFTTEAFPGTFFQGRISFIDPIIDPRTRTVKLRVNVTNEDGRLKPGMLVRATVESRVAGVGRVFDPYLAGKWISPMHPEIVKDGPGQCDICGMDLVPAESLGYVAREGADDVPLVVPASAPLITGKRAVVYVEEPGDDRPRYIGREVVLGPRAGEFYIVRSGLREGERVVVEGNFKIDSALQIEARPSMMNPEGAKGRPSHDHGDGDAHGTRVPAPAAHTRRDDATAAFMRELRPVYDGYVRLQAALAADDAGRARTALRELEESVGVVSGAGLPASPAGEWSRAQTALASVLATGADATEIAAVRETFRELSPVIIGLATHVGHDLPQSLVVVHCPMAFEDGADWLQVGEGIENPYFGESMFRCGEITRVLDRSDGVD